MKNQLKKTIVAVMSAILSATSIMGMTVSADVTDNSSDSIMGDANADGRFTIADVTLFQSWIMGNDVTLSNYQAVDFCEDGILDVFDLCMMKKELLNYNSSEEYPVKNPVVIDEFTPCTATIDDNFDIWLIDIIIKHQYSDPNRVWTVDDFKEVENVKSVKNNIIKVTENMEIEDNNIQFNIQYENTFPYRQVIRVYLKYPSKKNVLKMIHDIEELNIKEIKEIQTYKYPSGLPN